MPRAAKKQVAPRHDPLAVQMHAEQANDTGLLSAPGKRQKRQKTEKADETTLDAKVSRKVLAMARDQQDELAQEDIDELDEDVEATGAREMDDDSEGEDDEDEEDYSDNDFEEYEELEIDEGDQALLDSYLPQGQLEGGRTLADLIMEKIDAQEAGPAEPAPVREPPPGYNPKIVEVYTKVGGLLSRYKSGPLPKAFKILPTLSMWPTLLMLTMPENWTPHATYAATRIFASNLDPKQSQKFYKEILLEKVREEISSEGNKLSVHMYMALKKAIYKPAAFFKGILFPLCESGTCTLREAAIIGSVLTKVSVPVLHSGAALLKLADMDYTGPNSVFIRVLLDKKYALPYKVVDALVFHFIRFKRDPREMPVLWHQSFLVFCQRYKQDLTEEQKQALLETLRVKVHAQITPEIRREIVNSVARGEEIGVPGAESMMEVEIM
ncbi:Bystin-domain-containing protein [Leucosporidium creatinivorum]|uniref:Bystin n=1 Tax=Leucosporidium creatinivorum TaxID=106004 RepID=A0A1Y2G3A9_9BASI|nr:Bystin-domain-containing protein [Leucosporidium creatinivorum]